MKIKPLFGKSFVAACFGMAVLAIQPAALGATAVFSSSGAGAAAIQGQVDSFRSNLGALNANVANSFGSGRREINWDGVPDARAAPNNLPANFFNSNSPRGVVFTTSGTGFQVSANSGSPPIKFGNLDPSFPNMFATFSAQRLFAVLGSNVVDVNFFIPGSLTPALTRGFGSVFTDVDAPDTTSIEYFDSANQSLGTFFAPNAVGDQTLSFLGVAFDSAVISRVRITNGNQALLAQQGGGDFVVMDDFIYGEPVPVPEPTSAIMALVAASVALSSRVRRRIQS